MKKAVTLVEILLVVVLSALLMAVIIPFIRSVNDTWNVGSSKTEILQNGRASLETVTRYIRQAKRITKIPGSSGDYIKIRIRDTSNTDWADNDKYNIIFFHNVSTSPYYIGASGIIKDNDLVMRSDSSGAYVDSLLASSLDSLTFNFFRDDGTTDNDIKANQVKSVKIQMTLSDPLGSTTHTLALEDTVILRQDVKISSPVWFSQSSQTKQIGELSSDLWVGDLGAFSSPNSVSVNPSTGACWIADTGNSRIKKVSSIGIVLVDTTAAIKSPVSVSVNPAIDPASGGSGVCWAADSGNDRIKKFADGGTLLLDTFKIGAVRFKAPYSVSANPTDGSCWFADTGNNSIKKLSSTGDALLVNLSGFLAPRSVSVNPNEIVNGKETCWVADTGNNRIKKISYTGTTWAVSVDTSGFNQPQSVSVNWSIDPDTNLSGVCWVADTGNHRIKKLHPTTGEVLVNVSGFNQPRSASVDPTTGACWVADTGNNRIVRLNSAGDIEFDIKGFNSPLSVSARP